MVQPQWVRVREWERLYQEYQYASNDMTRLRPAPRDVVERYSRVSAELAQAWRAVLAGEHKPPWWVVAAVESAAQAFTDQAQRWAAVAAGQVGELGDSSPPVRPRLEAVSEPNASRLGLRAGNRERAR
ncbi:hypothetical protein [Amycolatopsis albispora]|uniref:hypothetical protein n=1 Tax=Amycolatopsis albispora TaxID=1804986 RepID=UPI0013B38C7D|nr:hypothetical protein [Amycolatopsis albispora]